MIPSLPKDPAAIVRGVILILTLIASLFGVNVGTQTADSSAATLEAVRDLRTVVESHERAIALLGHTVESHEAAIRRLSKAE